jgi:hypothetical protein
MASGGLAAWFNGQFPPKRSVSNYQEFLWISQNMNGKIDILNPLAIPQTIRSDPSRCGEAAI